MKRFNMRTSLALTASVAMLSGMLATAPAFAQDGTNAAEDEIITIGTRRHGSSRCD